MIATHEPRPIVEIVARRGDGVVSHLYANVDRRLSYAAENAFARVDRSQTVARAVPSKVSTLPSTRNPPGASASWKELNRRSCVSRSK